MQFIGFRALFIIEERNGVGVFSKFWCPEYSFFRVYSKIAVSLKFLLFYPNPKGDKRNFKMDYVQKWDTPLFLYLSNNIKLGRAEVGE
jgi:hypothetical protein